MTLDVDIHLEQGSFRLEAQFAAPDGITVVFGPSGGGKSTLLSAIAGLKRCRGRIFLGPRTLADCAARLHVPSHKRGLSMVFQDARLFVHLTVRQNIDYARRRAPAARRREIGDVAGFFDIAALLDRPVGNLSGGEKSRVALARALVAAPDFLLLDEPFAALDGARRRSFMRVLLDMHRTYGLPMLVVTHDIDDAAALGTHLVGLRDGKVVAAGAFSEVSRTPAFGALLDSRDLGAALSAQALRSVHALSGQSVWLRADQVLLAGEAPRAISARNVLAGEVLSVQPEDEGSLVVNLRTEAGQILSRVTAEAARELDIVPGRALWALVKAHTL
jgi:molybdate transport system ATP-binding protein